MAQQVKSITSESLEAAYRGLIPSQDGFTEDLMASNTIIPVLDLTSSAEGTSTPSYLTRAWDDSTGYTNVVNTTETLITNTGFWQVDLNFASDLGGAARNGTVFIDTGTGTVPIWEVNTTITSAAGQAIAVENQFVVFLRAGRSLKASTNNANANIDIWYRQLADINGTLVNPLGFTPQ